MLSQNKRVSFIYKGINEYKNFYFSDVYNIFVDDIYVGERHIDSSCNRDLFFVIGKKQYSQDAYENFSRIYSDKILADEECIIVKNEKDLLFFIDKIENM